MGEIIGGALFALVAGFFIVEICFPLSWRTRGVWLLTSLVGIPAFLGLIALAVAWPPLFVLFLILAFANNPVGSRKSTRRR